MKSPFAILLVTVVLIGIVIAAAAIFFLGPTDRDDNETIPIASESELPTPSTRNAPAQSQSDGDATRSEVVIVSTSVITEESSPDELPPEVQERIESGEGVVVITAEAGGQGGQRGFGGGPGGGAGGPNFQAIQEAMESNPEIQELLQKAQSGNMSQEDQTRLRELMEEALADAGIEAPGDGQGRGFGTPPTQGIISAISGSTITIDHNDDSGLSTDVEITDDTNIDIISLLTPADLSEGDNVAGTVQRGEGGRIFIINLTVIPEQQGQGRGGGFRGLFAGALGPDTVTNNDATNISNINGTIAEINDQQISVETTQGTLRLTANEDSNIISTSPGSLSDITQGMTAIAFGGNPPNNLIVGPETLLR